MEETIVDHQTMINFSSTLSSADIITEILSRLPVGSVLRCRHVCKTWRALIDDPLERILMINNFLPAHITINILSRLPADSIIQCCRRVCKTWQALIDDPSFADMHTRRYNSITSAAADMYSIGLFQCAYPLEENNFQLHFAEYNDGNPYKDVSLESSEPIIPHPAFPLDYNKWGLIRISSCNGLVFIGSSKSDVKDVFVCNPLTREYVNLVRNTSSYHKADDKDDNGSYMVYGFGYHPCSNVYKVVSIYVGGSDADPGVVSVYTLGSGSGWRNKGETSYKFFTRRPGVLANGAIHWMVKDDNGNKIIVSFDLADEKLRVIPSPPAPPSSDNIVDQVGVLGGCLCVTRSDETRGVTWKDIWVLNHHKEREKKYSWDRKFRIQWKDMLSNAEPHRAISKRPWKDMLSNPEPRAISKSGRILFRCSRYIVSYDPETEAAKCFEQPWKSQEWIDIVPYMKSLMSLKALGEDAKCFR